MSPESRPGGPVRLSTLLGDTGRVLSFRQPSPAISTDGPRYLAFGLLCTWQVGIGRYWDSPSAALWQKLGLGSVACVFLLAALLWVVVWPLRPKRWSYSIVLIFLTMTALPALLYAIPVERFLTLEESARANALFLLFVACYRVALLVWFLRRVAGLSHSALISATLLPLTFILFVLFSLNLEHATFQFMAGLRDVDPTSNDAAYMIVTLLSMVSIFVFPLTLLVYVVQVLLAREQARWK